MCVMQTIKFRLQQKILQSRTMPVEMESRHLQRLLLSSIVPVQMKSHLLQKILLSRTMPVKMKSSCVFGITGMFLLQVRSLLCCLSIHLNTRLFFGSKIGSTNINVSKLFCIVSLLPVSREEHIDDVLS